VKRWEQYNSKHMPSAGTVSQVLHENMRLPHNQPCHASWTKHRQVLCLCVLLWHAMRWAQHDSLVSCNVWVVSFVDWQLEGGHTIRNINIKYKVILLALMELIASCNSVTTWATHHSTNLLPLTPVHSRPYSTKQKILCALHQGQTHTFGNQWEQ